MSDVEKTKIACANDCACLDVGTSDPAGLIDQAREKIISRKLLVFVTATCLLGFQLGLTADAWAMIAMMYIGGQSAIDFAKIWKG